MEKARHTRAETSSDTKKITFELILPNEDYMYSIAFAASCIDPEDVYVPEEEEPDADNCLTFSLPEGRYNFFVNLNKDKGFEPTEIIFMEKLNVSTDTEKISVSLEDCTVRTTWRPTLADGSRFVWDSEPDPDANSTFISTAILVTMERLPLFSMDLKFLPAEIDFLTNVADGPINFSCSSLNVGNYGVAYLSWDVNTDGKEITTDKKNWKTAEYTFQPTPLNERLDEINAGMGSKPYYCYTDALMFLYDQNTTISFGGAFSSPWEANKISVYESGDNIIEVFPQAIGSDLFDSTGYIGSPYMNYTAGGLIPIGHNMCGRGDFMFGSDAGDPRSFAEGNPRYSGEEYLGVHLGNCTPAAVLIPKSKNGGTSFQFDYVGTYGEVMKIDAANLDRELENNPIIGNKYTGKFDDLVPQVCVSKNGEVICSKYYDFPDIDWSEGDFLTEITMNNVLIGGTLPGYNKCTVKSSGTAPSGELPTVTALQFRDSQDVITNRFENQDGAILEFFAGNFKKISSGYQYSSLSEIKTEWSPKGKDEWNDLKVDEIKDLFFMPGYGACYRADLSGIDRPGSDGWYDLRITVKSEEGNEQQQVVSPAFHISNLQGTVSELSNQLSKGKVYNLSGTLVLDNADASDIDALSPGIYILHTDRGTIKRVVR